ncbi:MAG: hypothetical protein JNJ88_08195 [Planctomycetes bacterium]|nr:hypothetical protein [Planctomycetota bacterium]
MILAAFLALLGQGAASAPASPALSRSLVIVAPRGFHAALAPLVELRRAQRPVEVVELESVLAQGRGADDPEKLKLFLYEAWRSRSAGYVLLVGDADVMPVRYMVLDRVTKEAFDYAFYPSDLYYGDVAKADGSFEDWNTRKDGFHAHYYGEVRGEKHKSDPVNFDGIDYVPELAVGRWPVSSADEVALLAKKTVNREEAARRAARSAASAIPWHRRSGFAVVGGWVDCRPQFERMAASLDARWSKQQYFYADGSAERPAPPSEGELVGFLNSGAGLLVHAGHGHDHGWEHSLSTASIEKLQNSEMLPIVLSAGCSTARFATLPPYEGYRDVLGAEHPGSNHGERFSAPPPPPAPYQRGKFNPSGFGEQLLRKGDGGAVAYFGCNTGSQPCGLTLVDGMVRGLATEGATLGDAWRDAIRHYFATEQLAALAPDDGWYPPSIFFQGMKFILFGDPCLTAAP